MNGGLLFLLLSLFCFSSLSSACCPGDSLKIMNGESQKRDGFFKRLLRDFTAVDTSYVSPNRYYASAMLLGEKHFNFFSLQSETNGKKQELLFSPNTPFRVGPYVGFSLFFLGYTFDVASGKSSFGSKNIAISIYSRIFGIDYLHESGRDDYNIKKVKGFGNEADKTIKNVAFSGMRTDMTNLHIYYIFNNRHFSYPAAYSQSTNQKRSTGSFLLGINYTKEKINFDYTKLPAALLKDGDGNNLLHDELKISNVRYRDYSFSIGYGYNWVFGKNFLANLTLSPTIGYNLSEGESFNTKEYLFDLGALNFDLISRASVVWNNSKFYAGIAALAHTYSYKKPTFSIHNSIVTLSIYTGFNFIRKKRH